MICSLFTSRLSSGRSSFSPTFARQTLNNYQCVLPAKQPLHGRSVIICVRFTCIVSVVSVRQTNKGEENLIPRTIIPPCPPLKETRIGLLRRRQKPLIAPIRRHLPFWRVIILVGIVVLFFVLSPSFPANTHIRLDKAQRQKSNFPSMSEPFRSTVERGRTVLICHVYPQKP